MNGHIRKRELKSGTSWQAIVELDPNPTNGKRRRVTKTYPRKRDAEIALAKMLVELNEDTYIHKNTHTLESYMNEWLDTFVRPSTSPTTYDSYERQIKNHIYPALGKVPVQNIKTTMIQKLYNDLSQKSTVSDKPLSAKTIKNIAMNLHAALGRAVIDGLIARNPADNVILPKGKKPAIEVYNQEETKLLLDAVKDTPLRLIVPMLLFLGLRRGELLALLWSDIDFEKGTVDINKNLVFVRGKSIIKEPKTQAGNRTITIPGALLEMLRKEYQRYRLLKLEKGAGFKDNNNVIFKEDGGYYNPDSITTSFDRLLKRKGLRHIKLHALRHQNATMLLSIGVDLKVTQARLGHSSYQITADTYSHVLESMDKMAVEKIDNELDKLLSNS